MINSQFFDDKSHTQSIPFYGGVILTVFEFQLLISMRSDIETFTVSNSWSAYCRLIFISAQLAQFRVESIGVARTFNWRE